MCVSYNYFAILILIDCILSCFCCDPTFSIQSENSFGFLHIWPVSRIAFAQLLFHTVFSMYKSCKCRYVLNENVYMQMYKRKEHTAKWSYPLLAEST